MRASVRRIPLALIVAACFLPVLTVGTGLSTTGRGAADPSTTVNGDVNCDGTVDIADAIYTLVWLFRDGQPPCAIAQEPGDCCAETLAKLDELKVTLEAVKVASAPRPQDMMSISRTIPGAGTADLLTVPDNRWLVVTGFYAYTTSDQWHSTIPGELHERTSPFTLEPRIVSSTRGDWRDSVGVAFSPGSTVVFVPAVSVVGPSLMVTGHFVDNP